MARTKAEIDKLSFDIRKTELLVEEQRSSPFFQENSKTFVCSGTKLILNYQKDRVYKFSKQCIITMPGFLGVHQRRVADGTSTKPKHC